MGDKGGTEEDIIGCVTACFLHHFSVPFFLEGVHRVIDVWQVSRSSHIVDMHQAMGVTGILVGGGGGSGAASSGCNLLGWCKTSWYGTGGGETSHFLIS